MKKLLTILSIFTTVYTFAQGAGINTRSPNQNALLHVSEGEASNKRYKGVLVPTFTTQERDANFGTLTAVDNGLVIFNKTENCFNFFKFEAGASSGAWINLCNNKTSVKKGIVNAYLGIPILVKNPNILTITAEMSDNQLASSMPVPINIKLPQDDWLQLDFGKRDLLANSVYLFINNLSSTEPLQISGRSFSSAFPGDITRAYTIPLNGSTPVPGIDPNNSIGIEGMFLYTEGDQVHYTFTATKAGVIRKYIAIWKSTDGIKTTSGEIKADLYQYEDGL